MGCNMYINSNKEGITMLKGLGGLGDMAGMMKKAQEMQTKMAEMQEELENVSVTGESGAGLVRATATAKGAIRDEQNDRRAGTSTGNEAALLREPPCQTPPKRSTI
jgi:hypothetical protein